ncbi:hypothetical protein AB0M20_35315 [Actinoplanes sp. NPDC051633]|uniref:hypothetical protein n=1 Tax=Actinoplanes sp. NPDC051633 TaxID=3155670 RepID=UPI0034212B46
MAFATRIRTAIAHRATERRAYRQLAKELAAFQTPAERAELDELIGRHSADETRLIRGILQQQDFERYQSAAGVGGHRAA